MYHYFLYFCYQIISLPESFSSFLEINLLGRVWLQEGLQILSQLYQPQKNITMCMLLVILWTTFLKKKKIVPDTQYEA